jgi:hypothetical protein
MPTSCLVDLVTNEVLAVQDSGEPIPATDTYRFLWVTGQSDSATETWIYDGVNVVAPADAVGERRRREKANLAEFVKFGTPYVDLDLTFDASSDAQRDGGTGAPITTDLSLTENSGIVYNGVVVQTDKETVGTFSGYRADARIEIAAVEALSGGALTNATYTGNLLDVTSEDNQCISMAMSPDGLHMYLLGASTTDVYEYSLTTPWDLSTASYTGNSLDVFPEGIVNCKGMYIRPNGLNLYVVGNTTDAVFQYDLTTAWDLSTAVYSTNTISVAAQSTNPWGVYIRPDTGQKMYILDQTSETVYQYTLSTPWDVSTAVYDTISFSAAATTAVPSDILFKSDGTQMYISDGSNNVAHIFDLASGWDISSASYSTFDIPVSQDGTLRQLAINETGGNIISIGGTGNTFYEYTLTPNFAEVPWTGKDENTLNLDAYQVVELSNLLYTYQRAVNEERARHEAIYDGFTTEAEFEAYDLIPEWSVSLLVGSSWNQIGASLSITTGSSVVAAPLVDEGILGIAYHDSTNNTLRKYSFDSATETWSQTGNALAIGGLVSASGLAFMTPDTVAFAVQGDDLLRTYQFDGTDWAQVGNSLNDPLMSGTSELAPMTPSRVCLNYGATGPGTIQAFDFDGTNWTTAGNTFTLGTAYICGMTNTTIAGIDSGGDLVCLEFDGTNWSQLGNIYTLPAIQPTMTRLNENHIFMYNQFTDSGKIYKFDGFNWSEVGEELVVDEDLNFANRPGLAGMSANALAYISKKAGELRYYEFT